MKFRLKYNAQHIMRISIDVPLLSRVTAVAVADPAERGTAAGSLVECFYNNVEIEYVVRSTNKHYVYSDV